MTDEDAIILKDVSKIFASYGLEKDATLALDSVSATFKKGTLTIVAGANGSGKSVLMTIIAGLEEASLGSVYCSSKPGLIFQDAATQILGDTPREDVTISLKNRGFSKKNAYPLAQKALEMVSLAHKADSPAQFLSGGEKRRLAVASILALERDILIFDEPYANLDFPGVKDVNVLIQDLKQNGKTIILLTHEIEKCLALADKFMVLFKGQIVFDGFPDEVLNLPLENWGIRNPVISYRNIKDMLW